MRYVGSVEVRPWDWTSTIVNTGIPGASPQAETPTPVLHTSVQGPGHPRSPLWPREPGRGRSPAQAVARARRPLEELALEGLEGLFQGDDQRGLEQERIAELERMVGRLTMELE